MVSPVLVVVAQVRWSILFHFEVPGRHRGTRPHPIWSPPPPDRFDRELDGISGVMS